MPGFTFVAHQVSEIFYKTYRGQLNAPLPARGQSIFSCVCINVLTFGLCVHNTSFADHVSRLLNIDLNQVRLTININFPSETSPEQGSENSQGWTKLLGRAGFVLPCDLRHQSGSAADLPVRPRINYKSEEMVIYQVVVIVPESEM